MIGTIAMGLNVVFSIAFSRLFASIGWMPHGGLALANSLATALEAAALFIVMRKRLSGIEGGHILRGVIPSAIAAIGMGFSLYSWLYFGNNFNVWILAIAGVIIGGGVYAAALFVLRVPELTYIKNGVLRRLRRS